MKINTLLQYEPEITKNDICAINDYLLSGGFITEFKKTELFEKRISRFIKCDYTTILPNGTLTLFSILKALGINKNSKVIVPNYTMAATAFSVSETGAEIIFCDVEWPSLCLSMDSLEETIDKNENINAIMFMNANGRYPSYKIDYLVELCSAKNIYLIEDSAQALGSFYPDGRHMGTVGVAGSISFSMPKIITTGQGGAVISNNQHLIETIRSYKNFGRKNSGGLDIHETIGLNMKFTDLQAILGISQLERINETIRTKKNNFKILKQLTKNKFLKILDNDVDFTTPWFYEVVTKYRSKLITWLEKHHIKSRIMYPELNKQKAFINHMQHKISFPISQRISSDGLWLPSHPKLTKKDIERIATILNEFNPRINY